MTLKHLPDHQLSRIFIIDTVPCSQNNRLRDERTSTRVDLYCGRRHRLRLEDGTNMGPLAKRRFTIIQAVAPLTECSLYSLLIPKAAFWSGLFRFRDSRQFLRRYVVKTTADIQKFFTSCVKSSLVVHDAFFCD